MDASVDIESKLIRVALLVAIGCLIAVHKLHSLLCHCVALLHHAATATLLHPQLPLLPLYSIPHWKRENVFVIVSHCQYELLFRVFQVKRHRWMSSSFTSLLKQRICEGFELFSLHTIFPFKNPSHIVFFPPIIRPFMYSAASWIVESLLCFSLFAVLKPFDPFMLSHL